MRFLADPSLGKLAKWLKILGHDTLYFLRANPGLLIEKARTDRRVVLTRDTDLKKRLVSTSLSHLFIQSNSISEQLQQVDAAFPLLTTARSFTRCLACNEELQSVFKEVVEGRVAEFVYQTQKNFVECPRCQKVYWPGTHRRRMEEKVNLWLGP
ncbi:MAG: Mut7-C RNAse domain-containing protein [Candidatus Binatia bacterium]